MMPAAYFPSESGGLVQTTLLAAPHKARGHFFVAPVRPPDGASIMTDADEWVEKLGRRVSVVVIVCLGALFFYGYLGRHILG
jgi:hypothetical protein